MPSQSPTFIPSLDGAACLLGDFLFNAAANGLYAGSSPGAAACLGEDPTLCLGLPDASDALRAARGRAEKTTPTLSRGRVARANFNAPPRTTTPATGNYGNGWRDFYAVSNECSPEPGHGLASREAPSGRDDAYTQRIHRMWLPEIDAQKRMPARVVGMTAPNYRRSRRAYVGPLPARAGLFFSVISSLVHSVDFLRLPISESIRTYRSASYAV